MLKKVFSWWIVGVIFISEFILGLLLRVYHLTIIPVFVDEAIYIRWAQVMKAESTLRFLPLSDGKPPLFMWSVIPALKLFSDPLVAGRIVSVCSGLMIIIGVFVLSYLLFNKKNVSLLAAFLYVISPFSVFFDRMALVDSMLSMFGIWTAIFAILTVKKLRLDFAMITGFLLGGAMLTKSPALFFEILLPSTILFLGWERIFSYNLKKLFKLTVLFAVTYIESQVIYNILRLGPNFQLLSQRNYDYVYPYIHILQNPLDPLIPHLKDIVGWFYALGPSFLIVLFVAGIILGIKKYRKETLFLLLFIFLPLFAQAMYAKVFTARYILFVVPYIVVLSSLFISEKKIMIKGVGYLLLLILVGQSLVQDFHLLFSPEKANLPRSERSGYLEDWTAGYGVKETAIYIQERYFANPQKQIVVGTDGYFGTLPDGLQIYLNKYPKIIVTGVGVKFTDVPKPLIDSAHSGNDTYLLVNSSRLYISDPKEVGLELVKSYPRGVKPNGLQEELILFRVSPAI